MPTEKTIKFQIVTPERLLMEEEITQVTVPTRQGEITVLPEHLPLVASLAPGVLGIRLKNGEAEVTSVSGGFIEVQKGKIVILADTAERGHEIDIDRAQEAKKRAEELKTKAEHFDEKQFADLASRIEKELARTKAAKKWKILNINPKKE
ncbi:MAG: ATP synthase F1 subunit epsilon [Candidatus Portnoybacteria bacterium]|nr:ATP synthase F1 subunit epsilon [Candidatus Portnoybacteria bacterium]